MNAQRWQDGLSALIGLYVVLSPHIVPHFYPGSSVPGAAALTHYLVGAAICLVGIAALSNSRFWQEWANLVLGSWLVVTPWALGFAGLRPVSWSAVLSGAVVVTLSASVLLASRRSHSDDIIRPQPRRSEDLSRLQADAKLGKEWRE